MSKREKAERLYNAMGEIDDIFIYEAMIYKKERKFDLRLRRLSLVLGALFLTFVSVLVINSIRNSGIFAPSFDGENTVDAPLSFTDILKSASGDIYYDKEQIDLFDGQSKLIYFDGESYKTIVLYENPANVIKKLSVNQTPVIPSDQSKVWISAGDGRVISPYLKLSAGNVGYNVLFDYDPELSPSAEFSQYIQQII